MFPMSLSSGSFGHIQLLKPDLGCGGGYSGSREEEETDPACQWPGHLDELGHGKDSKFCFEFLIT